MVDAVVKKWGKLTIGVNNAGIGQWVDAEDITDEIWQKVMRLNLDAVLYCAQAEARVMKKGRLREDHQHRIHVRAHREHAAEPDPVQRVQGRCPAHDARASPRSGRGTGSA